ncbi:hypothetical protein [Mycobacterium deserti]|uniref:RNA polymerase sigma-70 region 4 domain-containing protein n=1 Tax=Mycobacterium deserti TaxID=2978347 RepID=A0ABT2MJ53_9MYCO|nr:hypothetical protein [Mycobacterium deserti]MCT7661006.1 hypothetical protein [Mycobacterium deserti]
MTPREEVLATGMLGAEGARLLYATVRAVALGYGFPPPPGSLLWDASAIAEAAHGFLEGVRGQKRIADVTTRSVDERSFERILDSAVANYLRDAGRRTDLGKLILRTKEILRSRDEFLAVAPKKERWTLVDGSTDPSSVSPEILTRSIVAVEVVVPPWNSARRDAPLADEASFVRLIETLLRAAAGSLPAVDIAHALTSRLDHRRTPLSVEVDILDGVGEPLQPALDPALAAISELHAAEIFGRLSDRERIIVARLDSSIRDLATHIGVGKSQAALIRQRLFDKLAKDFDDPASAEATSAALTRFCGDWVEYRTPTPSATS